MLAKKSKAKDEKEKRKAIAMHDAIRRGSFSEIKKLLRKIPVDSTNSAQQTPLHTASIEGQIQVISYLLKKNAYVNARDRDGWTPLHCACHSGHLKIVEILIANNAEVCVETANGSVPLDYFVRMTEQDSYSALFERLFRTMIRKGADVNRANQQGEYPIHMAASRGKEKSLKLLILNQANVNSQNKNGDTALHLATRGGFVGCVKILLEAKTNLKLSGQKGNCIQTAEETNNSSIINAYKEFLGGDEEYKKALSSVSCGRKSDPQPIPSVEEMSPKEEILPSLPLSFTDRNIHLLSPDDAITHVSEAGGSWNPQQIPSEFSNQFLSPRSPGSLSPTNTNSGRGFSFTTTYARTSLSPSKESSHSRTQSTSARTSPRSPRKSRKKRTSERPGAKYSSGSEPIISIKVPPSIGNYAIGDCIGSGAYGSVYSGFHKETGELVAIKRVSLSGIPPQELDVVMAELTLLRRLQYEHITQYIGFINDGSHLNIILEFIEGGSLATVIQKYGGVSEQLCARYVIQTLMGLEYLHKQNIIHRDIKCANILVTKTGLIKLADFGIASVVDHTKEEEKQDVAGSPYWMAPEVIKLQGASAASDIWSLGCTIIELLTGTPPYHELPPMSAIFAMVKEDHPPLPENISTELKDFLLSCFGKVQERPSSTELLSHPWLRKHNNNAS